VPTDPVMLLLLVLLPVAAVPRAPAASSFLREPPLPLLVPLPLLRLSLPALATTSIGPILRPTMQQLMPRRRALGVHPVPPPFIRPPIATPIAPIMRPWGAPEGSPAIWWQPAIWRRASAILLSSLVRQQAVAQGGTHVRVPARRPAVVLAGFWMVAVVMSALRPPHIVLPVA
jgi:hypothetical protein